MLPTRPGSWPSARERMISLGLFEMGTQGKHRNSVRAAMVAGASSCTSRKNCHASKYIHDYRERRSLSSTVLRKTKNVAPCYSACQGESTGIRRNAPKRFAEAAKARVSVLLKGVKGFASMTTAFFLKARFQVPTT